uniref:Testis-expressed sequence 9 protein n=1 Tax=Phlebotomus papatasi TaxID=29031 RepID=A0A1B0DFV2_PHLPP
MSDLFLQKEQELLKLNEEINVKTKTVLQKTEKNVSKGGVRKTVSRKKSEDRETKKSAKEVNVPSTSVTEETVETCSDAIPERMARKNVSSEGLIKFLKAKVSILQDEVDTHQKDSLKNSEQLQALQESQKNLESVRDQLTNKLNALHSQQKKLEARNEELELKLKNRDVDLTKQSRDLEAARRESKTLAQEKSTLERKLLKSQEDHESTKQSLASAYEREKEMRERTRMEKDAYEKQVRQLRKQRLNLIGAYKQQLLLLDNLKRQIVCLEEAKMIDFAEKEFTKILDWGK